MHAATAPALRLRLLLLIPWLWQCTTTAAAATNSLPDLSSYAPFVLPSGKQVDCSIHRAGFNGTLIDWKLPARSSDSPVRVRRPVHLLNATELERLNRAFQLQAELPDDEPRSSMARRRLHCAYCSPGVYMQEGSDATAVMKVHFGWTILPFHRMFTYFQERILGELLGDATFALPIWQWDDQTPSRALNFVPAAYMEQPALSAAVRSPHCWRRGERAAVPDLTFDPHGAIPDPASNDAARAANHAFLEQAMLAADDPELFVGRANGPGMIEIIHASLHGWLGDFTRPTGLGEDMDSASTAAHDPIFFAHHTNLDRLWELWKARMVRLGLPTHSEDPDFLDSQFLLFDEHARPVRVTLRDTLVSLEEMGIVNEGVEKYPSWMMLPVDASSRHSSRSESSAVVVEDVTEHLSAGKPLRIVGLKPVVASLPRPLVPGAGEVLEVEGISAHPAFRRAGFDVYINAYGGGDGHRSRRVFSRGQEEFLGSFDIWPVENRHPRAQEHGERRRLSMRWGLGLKRRLLGAGKVVEVSVVPTARTDAPEGSPPVEIRIARISIQTVGAAGDRRRTTPSSSSLPSSEATSLLATTVSKLGALDVGPSTLQVSHNYCFTILCPSIDWTHYGASTSRALSINKNVCRHIVTNSEIKTSVDTLSQILKVSLDHSAAGTIVVVPPPIATTCI